MRVYYNNFVDNTLHDVEVKGDRIRIGRGPENDIVLDSPFVAQRAAQITRGQGDQWEVTVLGMNAVTVGDGEIYGGKSARIQGGQSLRIFPFTITLERQDRSTPDDNSRRATLDQDLARLLYQVHLDLLARLNLRIQEKPPAFDNDDALLAFERNIEEIARARGLLDKRLAATCDHCAGRSVRGEILSLLIDPADATGEFRDRDRDVWNVDARWSRIFTSVQEREDELATLATRIVKEFALEGIQDVTEKLDRVDRTFWGVWETRASRSVQVEMRRYLALRYVKKEIKDIVYGYGPLEDLLRIPTISEIMVVDRDHIYVEKNGVVENSGRRFISDDVTQAIIERIVGKVGRRVDRSSPIVDARLSDGSRVNAVLPPLAVRGPCLTVRKFPARRLMIDDLIKKKTLNQTVAEFLRAAVICRCNILISGGTGSGKTTLLNCLSNFIPDKERIVTIEDTAELQLLKEHVVSLESRPPNVEGKGAYTIRDLVTNALRMRPDRIVVGECRNAEALDMLQAMNTGHDGSMTTLHANSTLDALLRLEVLVQSAAEKLPVSSIHRQISSAIDLLVQIDRLSSGRRVVVQVSEVVGFDEDSGRALVKDIYALEGDNVATAELKPTGSLPTFMGELIDRKLLDLKSFYR